MAAAAFALFDAVILKGAVPRVDPAQTGPDPAASSRSRRKWLFVLFGLGTIQFARHPEGVLEHRQRLAAERYRKRLAKASASA